MITPDARFAMMSFVRNILIGRIVMNEKSAAFAQPIQPVLASMTRAHQVAAGQAEKWLALQMDSLRSYVDLAVAQVKVALKVTGPHSLHEFADSQFAVLSFVGHKVFDDSRGLKEWNINCQKQTVGLSRANLLTLLFKD